MDVSHIFELLSGGDSPAKLKYVDRHAFFCLTVQSACHSKQ